MSEVVNTGLTPADEDPVLHELLTSLPHLQPSRTLEDRVLSGVYRPSPAWARRARTAWIELTESGRIWILIGGVAAGSVIPLVALVVGAVMLAPHTGQVVSFTMNDIVPYLQSALAAPSASLIETLDQPLATIAGVNWLGWITSAATLCAGCGWGLYRTMTPRAARK